MSRKCGDNKERHLLCLATYRNYRKRNQEERRKKGRDHMQKLRAAQTEEQREKHREAQRRYRERYREQIVHRARRAAVKKNAQVGKETKLRPKARQYWSDPELASEEEEEEEEEW